VIVARNEAANLPRCLASVRGWTADIIVVLNATTDASESLARAAGAIVHHLPWQGFRDTKNAALALATQPWALCLDADEEVSPALRSDLAAFFTRSDFNQFAGAKFPRKVWFIDRWITHGDWYPDRKLRLLKREHAKAGGEPEHDKFVLSGPNETTRLEGDLLHYSFKDMSHYLRKQIEFTEAFALRERGAGHGFSLPQTLFRAWWRFFRAYVLRLGFLDGFPGLWIAGATGFFAFVRYSRTFEDQARRDA
jgi:glycosyltransferase involved in cell wall biosynthesis